MNNKRRRHSADFKFRVALEAAKGQKTTSQLSQEYGIHPTQISTWKRKLLSEGGIVWHLGDAAPTIV